MQWLIITSRLINDILKEEFWRNLNIILEMYHHTISNLSLQSALEIFLNRHHPFQTLERTWLWPNLDYQVDIRSQYEDYYFWAICLNNHGRDQKGWSRCHWIWLYSILNVLGYYLLATNPNIIVLTRRLANMVVYSLVKVAAFSEFFPKILASILVLTFRFSKKKGFSNSEFNIYWFLDY